MEEYGNRGGSNEINPAFSTKNIPIIFSADNNYAPMMAVAIYSLIKNASNKYNYDILIFNKDISEKNKEKIVDMIKEKKNFSLRFVDFSKIAKGLNLPTFKNYTIEIYFRLFMPYVLDKYDKAIYLDSDIVLAGDISKLWEEKLQGKTIRSSNRCWDGFALLYKRKTIYKKRIFFNSVSKSKSRSLF